MGEGTTGTENSGPTCMKDTNLFSDFGVLTEEGTLCMLQQWNGKGLEKIFFGHPSSRYSSLFHVFLSHKNSSLNFC